MNTQTNNHYVYIIQGYNNIKKKHYIGYTNDLKKRIRQHNQEIKGGAKATKGYTWKYVGIISGIKDNIEALQIEWRLKHATKKRGILNRIEAFLEYIEQNDNPSANKNLGTEFELMKHMLTINLDKSICDDFNIIKKDWKHTIINMVCEINVDEIC